jgi:hypothetical protein
MVSFAMPLPFFSRQFTMPFCSFLVSIILI